MNSPAPPRPAIDFMSGQFFGEDPYQAFAWMREHAPVCYDEVNDLWALARYDDVKAAGTDTATFSSAGGVRPKFPAIPMMIDFDAPEHVRRRRLVSAGFTPRRVRELEDHVRAVCDNVIDQVCEAGSCDFVRDLAAPLPLNMIGDLLGVAPADRADLLRWSENMLASQGDTSQESLEGATQAFIEYTAYIEPVLDDRRRRGASDDLIGVLVQAEIDGDRLDQASLIHESLLILIGGDETTRHVLSGGMLALQENPDQTRTAPGRPVAAPRCRRGDAALGNSDQEHGQDYHPGRRVAWGSDSGRRRGHADVSVGQPGRVSVRRSRPFQCRPGPEPPPSFRLRSPFLPWQSARPA